MMRSLIFVLLFLGSQTLYATEQWLEIRSPFFTVYTNAGELKGSQVAVALEKGRAMLSLRHPEYVLDSGRPLVVFAARNIGGLLKFQGSGMKNTVWLNRMGLFKSGLLQNYLIFRVQSGNDVSKNAFHEYLHYIHKINYAHLPVWLDEGLAEYFEESSLEYGTATMGYAKPNFVWAMENAPMPPLESVLTSQKDSPNVQLINRVGTFYAQSWGLVHMLAQTDKLDTLLLHLRSDEPPEEAVRNCLGDIDQVQKDLGRYIHAHTFVPEKMPLRFKANRKSYSIRPLSASELAGRKLFMFVDQQDADASQRVLEKDAASDPEDPRWLEALAYHNFRLHQWEACQESLDQLKKQGNTDYLATFLQGWSLQEQGQNETALSYFQEALRTNPTFAPAYLQLAIILAEDPDPARRSEAVSLARQCLALEKGSARSQYILLTTLEKAGERAEAIALGVSILGRSPSPDIAVRVQKTISEASYSPATTAQ